MICDMDATLPIGLALPRGPDYFQQVARGAAEAAGQMDLDVHLLREAWLNNPGELDRCSAFIALVFDDEAERTLHATGKPVVNVSNTKADSMLPQVIGDDVAVGRMAADHFLDRGFADLAYCSEVARQYALERGRGFLQRAAEAGAVRHVSLDETALFTTSTDQYLASIEPWMTSLPVATGIFCATDHIAETVLHKAHKIGRRVPEELAVLGVDNDELRCLLNRPPLSSIERNGRHVGVLAMHRLAKLMSGHTVEPRCIRVPPVGVVTRRSTETLAVADRDVATALHMMWNAKGLPPQVEQIAAHVGLSSRQLQRRFRKALGRTPLEEMQRIKLDRVRRLLITTHLPIHTIAANAGFSTHVRMSAMFRSAFGMTPTQYRHTHGLPTSPTEIAPLPNRDGRVAAPSSSPAANDAAT